MDLAELKNRDIRELPESPPVNGSRGLAYRTDLGAMYSSEAEGFLEGQTFEELKGEVKLLFTSPPFPLNEKKSYGNLKGDEYLEWLSDFASLFSQLLTDDGSIVMELGNAWEPKEPAMSTLPLEALLRFKENGDLYLCQKFVGHNTARLPTPAQWVNIERIRVKDSFTNIWWMSPTKRPDADNRRVLQEYSESMKQLLDSGDYNSGERPSEHDIGEDSFLEDNGGSIPPNVLEFSNTASRGPYLDYCREKDIEYHPARMAPALPKFFIRFLTQPGDLVFDPFGGSNTTGAVAEGMDRRWIALEPEWEYVRGSIGRFEGVDIPVEVETEDNLPLPDESLTGRCEAIADHNGERCSFSSLPAARYCGHHLPIVRRNGHHPVKERCTAETNDGSQCSNSSQPNSEFCGLHAENHDGDG